MLKKCVCVCFCILLLCTVCSCNVPDVTTSDISVQDEDSYRTVNMEYYNVSFRLPNDWHIDMEDAEVDLFCTNGKLHMAVYGFFTEDFSEDTQALKIWEQQNETALQELSNVRQLDHTPTFESTDKDLETALYSSEIDDIKQYSYYIFAQDKDNSKVFLWISFNGQPSKVRDNFDVLEEIVDSIRFN